RRDIDRRLLPSDLSSEDTEGSQLPLLRHGTGGRARRIPPVPAVPARTGAWQCSGGRCAADCAVDRSASRGRAARRGRRARNACRSVRAQLATDSPYRPEGTGRPTYSAAADASALARQTTADRDDLANDGGGVRQWLFERASVQRRLQEAL